MACMGAFLSIHDHTHCSRDVWYKLTSSVPLHYENLPVQYTEIFFRRKKNEISLENG